MTDPARAEALRERIKLKISEYGDARQAEDGSDAHTLFVVLWGLISDYAALQGNTPAAPAEPRLDSLDLYKRVCDIWAEANAVDTVIGRPEVLREKLAKLRDDLGRCTDAYIAAPAEKQEPLNILSSGEVALWRKHIPKDQRRHVSYFAVANFLAALKAEGANTPAADAPFCERHQLPQTRNPHPKAGDPSLEFGYQWQCIPCLVMSRAGWSKRCHEAENRVRELEGANTPAEPDSVQLFGVRRDGSQVALGTMRMPTKMKAREIVREMLGEPDEEAGNDAAMALWCCQQLIDWMVAPSSTEPPASAEVAITDEQIEAACDKAGVTWHCDSTLRGVTADGFRAVFAALAAAKK